MKRILCLVSALSFASFIACSLMTSNAIASEKMKGEGEQKAAKKTTAKDRVCGMEVQKGKAHKLEYNGKTYYFCSDKCEESFKKEPAKYQKKKGKNSKEEKKEVPHEEPEND